MKEKLRKYFWSIEGALFWFGGFLSVALSWIMYAVSHELNGQHDPTFMVVTAYIAALMFALGLKGSRRPLNGNGTNKYPGELWAVFLIFTAFIVWIEYYTPLQFCTYLFPSVGPAKKNPEQLAYAVIGVVGIFGAVKFQVITVLKVLGKNLLKRFGVSLETK